MNATKKLSHAEEILTSLHDPEEIDRFTSARGLLKKHLILKRDILNGKDFLFSGAHEEVHRALRNLIIIEHKAGRFLEFDYAEIDDIFLLRVVGEACHQDIIDTYFDI